MAKRHKKRWSTLLTFREVQIKTTIRCHPTLVECPSLKILQIIKAGEGVEKKEPSYPLGPECKISAAVMENRSS